MNMTGKQLSYFYANSNTTPEFHQMPSSLTLLHTVKNTFERIHSNRKFVSVSQSNDKKVLNCTTFEYKSLHNYV